MSQPVPKCPVHISTAMQPTARPIPKSPRARQKMQREPFLRFRCAVSGCPRVEIVMLSGRGVTHEKNRG
jgi:hypothetical protein